MLLEFLRLCGQQDLYKRKKDVLDKDHVKGTFKTMNVYEYVSKK